MPDVKFSNQYPYTDFHELNLDWVIKEVKYWSTKVGKTIQSIELTGTAGLVDTYTINYSDGTTSTFVVTNGNGIVSIAKTGTVGLIDTYTITYSDGSTSTFDVTNGNGIVSVAKTGTAGLDDTYTITFTDGTTTTFTVTNGTAAIEQTPGGNTDRTMSQKAITDRLLDNMSAAIHDVALDSIVSSYSTKVKIDNGTIVFEPPLQSLNYAFFNNRTLVFDGSQDDGYSYIIVAKGSNGIVVASANKFLYYIGYSLSPIKQLATWSQYDPRLYKYIVSIEGESVFFMGRSFNGLSYQSIEFTKTDIEGFLTTEGVTDTITLTLGYSRAVHSDTPAGIEFYHEPVSARSFPYEGKVINCFGDSITYGAGSSDSTKYAYPVRLAELTLATVNNYGLNGSKVSEIPGDTTQSFVERWSGMSDADLVIICGGTNDYWHQLTDIGTMASTSTETFYGALKNVIGGLATKNPATKLAFIIPYQEYFQGNTTRADFGKGTFADFRAAIKEVCEFYSVPVLDLYSDWGYSFPDSSYARTLLSSDGLHLNDTGYLYLANRVNDWIKTLI